MNPVKREQSGLLWRLLPSKARRRIAAHLSLEDIEKLNAAFDAYKKRSLAERRKIEEALRSDSRRTASAWPALLSAILTAIGTSFWIFYPERVPDAIRTALFTPVMLGALAPISLYLIPGYRLRILFRWPGRIESYAIFAGVTLALIWLVSLIGMEEIAGIVRQNRVTLIVLALGAGSAPLLEEVLFRELIPSLVGDSPHLVGHTISVLVFAAAHLPSSPYMFFLYVLAGALLSVLRIQSTGLFLPLLAHCSANVIVVLLRSW